MLPADDVDTDRVGTLGMSMSTKAWWLAAPTRVKVCVDIYGRRIFIH